MTTFADLARSRRQWIETELIPWCRNASRKELLLAEHEWVDLAGRPSPEATLWLWAWSRFPVLYDPRLSALNETREVVVITNSGTALMGYPDARKSLAGQLFLLGQDGTAHGPVSIDDIAKVELPSPNSVPS